MVPLKCVFMLAEGAWLLSLEERKETCYLLKFRSEVVKVSHVAKLYLKWTWIYDAVLERGGEYFE